MLPARPALEGPGNFICVFPESESALAFPVPLSSIFPTLSSPPSFPFLPPTPPSPIPQVSLFPHVRVVPDPSESGPGSQWELLWGIPGDRTHNPSWERIFQKIFLVTAW